MEPDSVEYGFLYEQVRLSVSSLCVLTFVICWVYTSLLLQVKFLFQVIQLNGLSATATLGTEEKDLCREV